jgi:hypothetical protein
MFRSSWRGVSHLAARAIEGCAGQKRRRMVPASQTSLATVHKVENMLTRNFDASGIGPLQRSREPFPTGRDTAGNRET